MLRLLSIAAGLPATLIVLIGIGLYTTYGEVDPCRVLAVERARQAEGEMGSDSDRTVVPWMRAQTSQLSTGQCTRELLHSWRSGEEKAENPGGRDYADEPDSRVRDDGGDYEDDGGYERYGD